MSECPRSSKACALEGARLIATILIATPTGSLAVQSLRASAVLIAEFINEDAAGGGAFGAHSRARERRP